MESKIEKILIAVDNGMYIHDALLAIKEVVKEEIESIPNPCPENIFIPPTEEQYKILHEKLQEVGLTIDKFSGDLGRIAFRYFKKEMLKRLEEGF